VVIFNFILNARQLIDGQVHLVRLQTGKVRLFLRKQTENDKLPFAREQAVNGLRKIARALFSV
jgi:hypothetical protein